MSQQQQHSSVVEGSDDEIPLTIKFPESYAHEYIGIRVKNCKCAVVAVVVVVAVPVAVVIVVMFILFHNITPFPPSLSLLFPSHLSSSVKLATRIGDLLTGIQQHMQLTELDKDKDIGFYVNSRNLWLDNNCTLSQYHGLQLLVCKRGREGARVWESERVCVCECERKYEMGCCFMSRENELLLLPFVRLWVM